MAEKNAQKNILRRAPVVCVMGHVDHGKSTLLDYVRKSNITASEAGGITQKIGAYEIEHTGEGGEKRPITFLDTPGHEAFTAIRSRGANVADIAVLVVSAEDGVKPQTLDAYRCIKEAGIPFVVAINKIDKPGADVERTKQSLAENEIYLEGYGGDIPWSAISSKTGEGVDSMLEMIDLLADLHSVSGNADLPAKGYILEGHQDSRRGPAASVIVKDGTLRKGQYVVSGDALAPVRIMESDRGNLIDQAVMGMPVKITGWTKIPEAGLPFEAVDTKKEAGAKAEQFELGHKGTSAPAPSAESEVEGTITIPIIIKADATGSIDAILHELKKVQTDRAKIKIVSQGVGDISETDAKLAESIQGAVIIGFNSKLDSRAKAIAERSAIPVEQFDIIYKLSEWLTALLTTRTPKMKVEEQHGNARVLKVFSKEKDRQIVGAKVQDGKLEVGDEVIIERRETEIGRGKVRELQRMRNRVDEVAAGTEFGAMVEAKVSIAEGDILKPYKIIEM